MTWIVAQVVDPVAEHARAAAEGVGLPPWAIGLVSLLAPLLLALLREHLGRRRGDATVRAIVRGVEAASETLPAHQARAMKRAIAGEATAAGVERGLNAAVKRETTKHDPAKVAAMQTPPHGSAAPGPRGGHPPAGGAP